MRIVASYSRSHHAERTYPNSLLGKSASGLKEVADSFGEGLREGQVDAASLKTAKSDEILTAKVEEVKKESS